MSRDGLMPKIFSKLHPKYNTPSFSTILTGFVVAIPTFFMNIDELTDLTSIGTLFAFVLVCGGILLMKNKPGLPERKFKVPYVSGRFIMPVLLVLALIIVQIQNPKAWSDFFAVQKGTDWLDKLPMMVFLLTALGLTIASVSRKLSLIPVLGLLSCFYLMTELGYTNWLRFVIWLVIGLVVYFTYSRKKSKLHVKTAVEKQ
jgi:amino acid transporter